MDDDIKNPPENQSTPLPIDQPKTVYESVPVEENIQPEEVSADVSAPSTEDVSSGPPEIPPEMPPPVYEENKNRYIFIVGGGVLVFVIILFVILRLVMGGGKPKEIKLSYWGLWESEEIMKPLIQDYQNKNPNVIINYQKMSPQDYKDRLVVRSKNGQGPDIFRFHNTWLPQLEEVVAPLPTNIINNSQFESTFHKIHQQDLKLNGRYYGIPLYLDGLVLIYNENMLKKVGFDTAPADWNEMIDVATKLAVKDKDGQLITAGIAIGTASNIEHFSDIFTLMLLQNGGSLKELDKPEAAGALQAYRQFAEPPHDVWSESMPNSIVAFIQEKVGMIIAPSWWVINIKTENPDINVKVAPIPRLLSGRPISMASYWAEGVSKYSKNQLEAWKFLKFLSEKENMTKLFQLESQTRPFGEAYSRKDLVSVLENNEYLKPVINQADYYVSSPSAARTYDNGLNDQVIQYLENAINDTIRGTAYSEALKNIKGNLDTVFSHYKVN